jgi:hypothetical protein
MSPSDTMALLDIVARGRGEMNLASILAEATARGLSAHVDVSRGLEELLAARLLRRTASAATERWAVTPTGREKLNSLTRMLVGPRPRQGPLLAESDTVIDFEYGSAHAPDDLGLMVIMLTLSGHVRFAFQWQDQIRRARARVSPAAVQAVLDALRQAGFPNVPQHDRAPGGGHGRLVLYGELAGEAHFVASALQKDARYQAPVDTLIRWMDAIHDPAAHAHDPTIWDIDVLP